MDPTFALVPPRAVIELAFSPILTLGDWNLRLETLALAGVVLGALVLAVVVGYRTPVDWYRLPEEQRPEDVEQNHLRGDDLLYIALAAVPGAVAGGRLGYVLVHLDYYRANPAAILDPTQGAFQLSLAVLGGTLTAAIIAGLLGAPVRRWLHAATIPLLLAIAGGKLTLVLGGDGQGAPFDGQWATAYPGPGPWGSLAPEIPSHPSQVYEAIGIGIVILVLLALLGQGVFERRSGALFAVGIGLWAVARALVAATWRDPAVLWVLNADQLLSIAIATGALLVLLGVRVRGAPGRRRTADRRSDARSGLEWSDPATRPRF